MLGRGVFPLFDGRGVSPGPGVAEGEGVVGGGPDGRAVIGGGLSVLTGSTAIATGDGLLKAASRRTGLTASQETVTAQAVAAAQTVP
ncbi:hypothetical protein GCM10010468_06530 [Actinocorallia longicatena]|uniref:Uncharacterized protein n=1 Tax=Actinocorallia longicatena TaxID=111803 RepID=A0ABP6PYP8_9ACTN